jgi:hypothetical protein
MCSALETGRYQAPYSKAEEFTRAASTVNTRSLEGDIANRYGLDRLAKASGEFYGRADNLSLCSIQVGTPVCRHWFREAARGMACAKALSQ